MAKSPVPGAEVRDDAGACGKDGIRGFITLRRECDDGGSDDVDTNEGVALQVSFADDGSRLAEDHALPSFEVKNFGAVFDYLWYGGKVVVKLKGVYTS